MTGRLSSCRVTVGELMHGHSLVRWHQTFPSRRAGAIIAASLAARYVGWFITGRGSQTPIARHIS